MLIDITLKITPHMAEDAQGNLKKALTGHLGTHFDVMDKEFPLEYSERRGVVFDVRSALGREIELSDVDLGRVERDMFVAFYSGYIEREEYGTRAYFSDSPQMSNELVEALLKKEISLIGVDFAGLRRGSEHTPTDQRCADCGVFVIENMCNLGAVLEAGGEFTACTYPMSYAGMTGLPCRVIARI